MKKGYIKLLIFELLILFALLANSFFITFLSQLGTCIFLSITLILFKYIFGLERDRHRYVKDIILDIVIFLIIFFLIYYLSGLIIGFTNSINIYPTNSKIKTIIFLLISITLKEFLRYAMLCKSELSKITTISTIILFIFLEISTAITHADFSDGYSIFKFIAMIVIPAITTNVAHSYVCRNTGYKPAIFYSIIMSLYPYIIPIIPNVNNYLHSLIQMIHPCIYMLIVFSFIKKSKNKKEEEREYYKNKYKAINLVPIITFILLIIYFYSGYFRYWVIAIASGSMKPGISIGDLVVVDQKIDKTNLKKGDIIAYKNGNSIIVHRIEETIISNNEKYYITKGDANQKPDTIIVDESMILGDVKTKIPYVGTPTVWIHEMLN